MHLDHTDRELPKTTGKDVSAPKVTYHVKIASSSEYKKPPPKRANKVQLLKVPQSLTWGNLQDAIVEKAANALGLSLLICNYNIFETLFTIPRKIPDPTPLQPESDYEILLESINNMKEPAINIFVCHLKVQYFCCALSTTHDLRI
jgi:hypothetical protein